jgi:hypothetical protein
LFFPVEERERQERNRSRQLPTKGGEESANLDFMLALSLQNEGQVSKVAEQDFWRTVCEADQSHGGPSSLSDIKGRFYSALVSLQFLLVLPYTTHKIEIILHETEFACLLCFFQLIFIRIAF